MLERMMVVASRHNSALDLRSKLTGTLSAGMELVCLSAIGAASAAMMWAILEPVSPAQSADLSTLKARSPQLNASDLAALRHAPDPFARSAPAPVSNNPNTTTAEGFTLHATRVNATGESSAILSAAGIAQAIYHVGETIDDAELTDIQSTHVDLTRNGRNIRLAFPANGNGTIASPAQTPTQDPTQLHALNSPDRTELINAMALKSVDRPNGQIGFEIVPRGDATMLARVGLQPGDIVLGVNGANLNANNFTEHRSEILSGAPVEIRFERGGQVMTTRLGRAAQ